MAPDDGFSFNIHDCEGVRTATITLHRGINQLEGPNGAGKSSIKDAITGALGGDVDVEPRDGSRAGYGLVEGFYPDGRPMFRWRVGNVKKRTGALDLSLIDAGPLARLITGENRKDAKSRHRERYKAFLEIVRPPVDAAAVVRLCDADPALAKKAAEIHASDPHAFPSPLAALVFLGEEEQPETESGLASWLAHQVEIGAVGDLLTAATILADRAHLLKRQRQEAAQAAQAKASALRDRITTADQKMRDFGGEPPANPDPKRADSLVLEAGRTLDRLTTESELREQIEARQEQIKAARRLRPDVTAAHAAVELAQESHDRAAARVLQMRQQLALAEQAAATAAQRLQQAQAGAQHVTRDHQQWEDEQQFLDEPLTNAAGAPLATAAQVLDATIALEEARATAERHRVQAQVVEDLKSEGESLRAFSESGAAAAVLEGFAQTVPDRMAVVLASLGLSSATVIGGELHARNPKNPEQWVPVDSRLSDGERHAWALGILASVVDPGPDHYAVVSLDWRFWVSLTDSRRAEFAALAWEHNLAVVTEYPKDGPFQIAHLAGGHEPDRVTPLENQ